MILVLLGTQNLSFKRLLNAIQKQIDKGNIKDKVIVQAGFTKYNSKDMEIFDTVSEEKLYELIKEADLIITHGGVGSIMAAITNNKKVIAAARLKKYKEAVNNHQLQIINYFKEKGYILSLDNFNELDRLLKKIKHFNPLKYKKDNNNIVKLIEEYIGKI
ncbi:MAG: PssE/Cps14G family polysaccharide biosynthesis glycosyltransferase [Bacilli bacterium]|jgi:UDP-N-acetylglucosamine transferase subunit ALG13